MPKGKILANALHYMAGQGAMAVFGFTSSVILARFLPKETFGQYSYYLALAIIALPFLDMGGHTLYAILGARDRSRIGLSWARTIALKFYALPVTAILLAGYFFATTGTLGQAFLLVLLYTAAQSVLLSTDVAFRPAEQGRAWAIRRVVYEVSSFSLLSVAAIFFSVHSAKILLFLSAVAVMVSGIWAVISVIRMTGLTTSDFRKTCLEPFRRAEIQALWPFALNTALAVIYYREINVLLELFGAHARDALANFRVISVITIAALYIPRAVTWAAVPRISLHDAQDDHLAASNLIRDAAGVNTFIAVFLTVGGLLYGEHLIGTIFGEKYRHLGVAWTLFDLVLGLLFVQQFLTDLLNGIREERRIVYGFIAGIVILTAGSIYAIPRYGIAGAGAAQLAACLVMVPLNLRFLSKRVRASNLHGVAFIRLAAVAAVCAAIGYVLMKANFYLSLAVFTIAFAALSYFAGAMPTQFRRLTHRLLGLAA